MDFTTVENQINEIIQRGRERGKVPGCEVHHIIMRSLGGLDIPENLVPLLPREHYDIHKLYFERNRTCEKSASAFLFMSDQHRIQTGKEYEAARSLVRDIMHNRNKWIDNRLWHPNHGIISLTTEYTLNDMTNDIFNKNATGKLANLSLVLQGKIPSYDKKNWKLADTGLYEEVAERYYRPWNEMYLKNIITNEIILLHRSGTQKFHRTHDIPSNGGVVNILWRNPGRSLYKWTLADPSEWDGKVEFK